MMRSSLLGKFVLHMAATLKATVIQILLIMNLNIFSKPCDPITVGSSVLIEFVSSLTTS